MPKPHLALVLVEHLALVRVWVIPEEAAVAGQQEAQRALLGSALHRTSDGARRCGLGIGLRAVADRELAISAARRHLRHLLLGVGASQLRCCRSLAYRACGIARLHLAVRRTLRVWLSVAPVVPAFFNSSMTSSLSC